MSRFKKAKPEPKPTKTGVAHFVREGKECVHGGITYRGGDEFTPFDELSVSAQNTHLPNLERREVVVEVAPELTPEETVEVIDQETETPTEPQDDVLI
jgi:hypothetical protein